MRLWVNGRSIADPEAPALSAMDHGLTVGDGVFETIKVVGSTPFAVTRHLDRLDRSAAGLGLTLPDRDAVHEGISAVLDGWHAELARLRITVTAGPGPFGSDRGSSGNSLIIGLSSVAVPSETTAVVTVPWTRNERGALAGLKTTSYADNVLALAYAKERGGTEAVFANTVGQLCECTGSNVFVVRDGRLMTPRLESGCLAGVTRRLVVEWCGAEEVDLPLDALQEADEVFLTSTIRDVQPVHRVDEREVAAPGPVTTKARAVFAERSAEVVDP